MFGNVPSCVGEELWGDGFAADSWVQIVSVRSWDQCEADEMIRVFPHLLQGSRGLAPPVRSQLIRCLETLDRKRQPSAGDRPNIFRWRRSREQKTGADRRVSSLTERRRSARKAIGDIVSAFDHGPVPSYDESSAREIAFWAGVHPAYLWREVLVSHDHFTALGWLGHAERKGRALLPLDVADFFLDAIVRFDDGSLVLADDRISRYILSLCVLKSLYSASRRRSEGLEHVFDAFSTGCVPREDRGH